MQISLKWLNDYVDIADLPPTQIAEALTGIGLEVEALATTAALSEKIIVAKIEQAEKHPKADKLRLCQVNTGAGTLRIVCGAANARAGIYVALAQIGTTMPNGLEIKEGKIRDELSQGMLCSASELGLSESSEGIIELPTLTLGSKINQIYATADSVLTLNVTPNRGDCLSYYGVARDLAAKLKRPLKKIQLTHPRDHKLDTHNQVTLKIAEGNACLRFVALEMDDISVIDSPLWLQARLKQAGMRPINLIVDCTNFVMLELGQPIHAYDARTIAGKTLGVRLAKANDKLKTLDGKDVALRESDIVIIDGEKPIGLAGIIGGENSEVKADSKRIIIEAAFFDPIHIRKTAKRLGMSSEASKRFEREVDIDNIAFAAERVAGLIYQCTQELNQLRDKKLPVPRVAGHYCEHYPKRFQPSHIALRLSRVRQIIGNSVLTQKECIEILEALQMPLVDSTNERMVFAIPGWRNDIVREVDLIEEITRMRGMDQIAYQLPKMDIYPNQEDSFLDFCEDLRNFAAENGMAETVTFPFSSHGEYLKFNLNADHVFWPKVELANAMSEEARFMQTTLLPGLMRAVINNRSHGVKGSRLFEMGRVFNQSLSTSTADSSSKANLTSDYLALMQQHGRHLTNEARAYQVSRPCERQSFAAILDFPFKAKGWRQSREEAVSFFHAKHQVVTLFKSLNLGALTFVSIHGNDFPFLNPKAAAVVKSGERTLGFLGELHPQMAFSFDLDVNELPVVFEFDLESIFLAKNESKLSITPVTHKFPGSSRDFAFVIDKKVSHDQFCAAISTFGERKHLAHWSLFDVYQGEHLSSDKKSFGFRFVFESRDKTLTDSEVDGEAQKLLKHLEKTMGAHLR